MIRCSKCGYTFDTALWVNELNYRNSIIGLINKSIYESKKNYYFLLYTAIHIC
jgi:hypothetical protein